MYSGIPSAGLKTAGAALHLLLSSLDLLGFSGALSAGFNRTARIDSDQCITTEPPFAVEWN